MDDQPGAERADVAAPQAGRGVPWGLVIPVLLVVGVLACFSPAFGGELLAWDDQANFVANTEWQGVGAKNLAWMATSFHLGHYQPLTWLSFGLQHAVGASSAAAMHIVNVLLHALNAVLFFWLSRGLLRAGFGNGASGRLVTLAAGLAAGLFALHPLRAESVAWVTERRDVLSTALLLGAALAYLKSVEIGRVKVRSMGWYAGCVALLLLSCLSKAWGMGFFVVLLAMDVYPLRRLPAGGSWLSRESVLVVAQKLPMVVIGLATAWAASMAQRATSATKTLEQWSVADRLVQAAYGLWFYVKQTLAPSGLSPLYQLPKHMDAAEHVGAIVFAAALLGGAAWCWKKQRAVSVALLTYLVLISPVLGLLQSGEQLVADRYSYLATMPLVLLAGAGVIVVVRRSGEGGAKVGKMLAAGLVVVISSLGLLTYSQAAVWRTNESLWEHAAKATPTSMVLVYYGNELQQKGRLEEAATAYERAVKVNPEDGRALLSYGTMLEAQGREREAEQAYREAIKYSKTFAYRAHLNVGTMCWRSGRRDEAVRQFELAIAEVERPGHKQPSGHPFMAMSMAKLELGEQAQAVALLKKATAYADTRAAAEGLLRQLGEPGKE